MTAGLHRTGDGHPWHGTSIGGMITSQTGGGPPWHGIGIGGMMAAFAGPLILGAIWGGVKILFNFTKLYRSVAFSKDSQDGFYLEVGYDGI